MFGIEEGGTDFTMLALESPKSNLLGSRRVAQLEKDRYMSEMEKKDKRFGSYSTKSADYSDLRDGAVNRSVDTGAYIKKKTKRTSKLDASSQGITKKDTVRSPKIKYIDYPKQKGRSASLTQTEDTHGEIFGLKKKSRFNRHKKDVLKVGMDTLDTLDTSKSYHLRPKLERESSFQRDPLTNEPIPERSGFSVTRDSNSYSDFSNLTQSVDGTPFKRLTSANRPKSAGQAMLMTDFDSDSDDSFYDGEIEVVDLDDPVFAYEREFEESKNYGKSPKSNRLDENNDSSIKRPSPKTSNHDDAENMSKQTVLSPDSGLGSDKQRPLSDRNYDAYIQSRPTTSRGRRRAQSEPEVERISAICHKSETRKSKQTLDNNKHFSQPFVSESLYKSSVDRVITKYSGLTVKKDGSNFKSQTSSHATRSDMCPPRAPLPRKLKPILRREKMGHVNSTACGEIDYHVSQ